jgi:hypothetical protein
VGGRLTLPPVVADLTTIVVTGKFAPFVMSPTWLKEQELINDNQSRDVEFELLIPNQAATFTVGWLKVVSNPQAIQLETKDQAETERMRDLAVNVIRALNETEVANLGINRNIHFSAPNTEEWHAVGDHLVHNDVWEGVLHLAGMRSVTFWGYRTDQFGGRVHVQVEPSFVYPPGVFLAYNDHYDLTTGHQVPASRSPADQAPESGESTLEKREVAITVLEENWQPSLQLFNQIFKKVADQMSLVDDL